ncbi:MAG: UDP-N-acetylmuramoylalanyl-D-glutamyl-2,6-diaminopimelate--D-alanyl-D-alanine ligase [Alphaproteobacteria bacterium]
MSAREILWHAMEATAATGGSATAGFEAQGVSIDTRSLAPGDLFVALKGDNHDGHDYVSAAFEAQAAAAMVSRKPANVGADRPLLLVPDTYEGLWALARAARTRAAARLVAVTGSVGKTGTKEMIARALDANGPTMASAGNLNNQFGAPLSLARLSPRAQYGVFELGMNHAGEIRPLAKLIRPHVALITTVQAAHLAFFDSIEAIADAKAEIFEGLEPGGAALINRDDPSYRRLAAAARRAAASSLMSFGAHEDADARLLSWQADDEGGTVEADIAGQRLRYRLRLAGRHWALNSVAALLAVRAAGADAARGAAALAGLAPLKGRGARHTVHLADGSFELIDESYNASPAAMIAAIEALAARRPGPGGRRIAVLGDMLELGPDAAKLHAGLAEPLKRAKIDLALLAGPLMAHLDAALPASRRGGHAADSTALAPRVCATVRAGDVVLVKGSLGSRMAPIVAALLALEADRVREAGRAL